MRRWALNILAGLSLGLFLATAVIWVRSYWVADLVGYQIAPGRGDPQPVCVYHLVTAKGGVGYVISRTPRTLIPASGPAQTERGFFCHSTSRVMYPGSWYPTRSVWNRLGFYWVSNSTPQGHSGMIVAIPCWFATALTSLIPATLARRVLTRHRRRRRGLCLTCGYDLRASPERCPECGTPKPHSNSGQAGRAVSGLLSEGRAP